MPIRQIREYAELMRAGDDAIDYYRERLAER